MAFKQIISVTFLSLVLISCTPSQSEGELIPAESGMVTEVIDGDTFKVRTYEGELITVRLLGIDFPDLGKNRIQYWLDRGWEREHLERCFDLGNRKITDFVVNAKVKLSTDTLQNKTDKYGRELRYVFLDLPVQTSSLNEQLVGFGWAVMSSKYPDCTLCPKLKAIEDEAKETDNGCLWEEDYI